jgi:hypothetical protein
MHRLRGRKAPPRHRRRPAPISRRPARPSRRPPARRLSPCHPRGGGGAGWCGWPGKLFLSVTARGPRSAAHFSWAGPGHGAGAANRPGSDAEGDRGPPRSVPGAARRDRGRAWSSPVSMRDATLIKKYLNDPMEIRRVAGIAPLMRETRRPVIPAIRSLDMTRSRSSR